eukprot:m.1650309 g.1650309  ORF g.1650309 m.1650309 type:complete len:57 (-) comp85985_c0_seq1:44-214(-)
MCYQTPSASLLRQRNRVEFQVLILTTIGHQEKTTEIANCIYWLLTATTPTSSPPNS